MGSEYRYALLFMLLSPTVAASAVAPIVAPKRVVRLPNGIIGRQYDRPISASGGQPPYRFSVQKGLPPGLATLSDGRLVGTPTATGTFDMQIVVRDAAVPPKEATENYRLQINAPAHHPKN